MADSDDEIDPALLRRRQLKAKARRRRQIVIAAAASLGIIVLGIVIVGQIQRRGGSLSIGGPSASSEGENWDHKELLAHFNRKGLNLRMKSAGVGAYFYGPRTAESTAENPAYIELGFKAGASDCVDLVLVTLYSSPQEAKEAMGVHGNRSWHWGRFGFRVNEIALPMLDKVKSALGNK